MAELKQGIVILDNSEGAYQAAYAAFHIAARSGMNLVGAVTLVPPDSDEAHHLRRDFDIGARAARVKASTVYLEDASPAALVQRFSRLDTVLLSQQEATERLKEYIDQLPCPVWIIPGQRSIRRILVIPESSLPTSPALALAGAITRSWGVDLHLLLPAHRSIERELLSQVAGLPLTIASLPAQPWKAKPEPEPDEVPSPESILHVIQATLIDLVLIDRENTWLPALDFCQNCPCLVVVCPAEKG